MELFDALLHIAVLRSTAGQLDQVHGLPARQPADHCAAVSALAAQTALRQ